MLPTVYILTNARRTVLYTGVTSDLANRVSAHRFGAADSFTHKYATTRLVWYELHEEMLQAIRREKAIKRWRRAWKITLIEAKNPQWRDLSMELF